jgi:hypothetical protein
MATYSKEDIKHQKNREETVEGANSDEKDSTTACFTT